MILQRRPPMKTKPRFVSARGSPSAYPADIVATLVGGGEAPRAPVAERRPGGKLAHLRDARLERKDGLHLERLASVRIEAPVQVDARPHHRERTPRRLREVVDRIRRGHVNLTERDALLSA